MFNKTSKTRKIDVCLSLEFHFVRSFENNFSELIYTMKKRSNLFISDEQYPDSEENTGTYAV
jgi:hypothetical protein